MCFFLICSAPRPSKPRQLGSGLIEVLILIFVTSLGMLAMGKIHTVLLRDGGTANSRAMAASLAQQKIDDLRAFRWVDNTQANLYSENCGVNDVNCFINIGTNTGGRLNTGALRYPSGSITLGNTTFTRSWTVQDNFFCGGTSLVTSCASSTTPDVKIVDVVISWLDANDADPSTPNVLDAHRVLLRSAIARNDSLLLSFTAGGGVSAGGYGPKVNYVAGAAPDVVAIPIQQGSVSRETTKPLPDVVVAGSNIVTQFQTVTYNTGGDTTKQQLDDYLTLTCSCKFTSDGPGNTASYYYWDNVSKTLKVKYPAAPITKKRGTENVNGQHPLCSTCCNDHHDTTGTSTAKYDSQRPAGDYTASGNHKHYNYVNASNPAEGLQVVAETNNTAYLEACRFLRVDGVYRLMQDWIAKDIIVLPKDNYLTNSSKLTNYQNYIQKVVQYNASATCLEAASQNSSSDSDCASISQSSPPVKSSLLSTRDLSNVTGAAQLISRSVYIDPVFRTSAPTVLDTTYYNTLAQRIAANQTNSTKVWLDIVPFNEVNTTLLTSWDKSPLGNNIFNVSDENIVDVSANVINYYGVYSRGLVSIRESGSADVYAYLLPGNTGLTGGMRQSNYANTIDYNSSLAISGTIPYRSAIGMDAHDHRSANRLSNSINISTSPTPGINGLVRLGNRLGKLSTVSINAVPSSGGESIPCVITGEGSVAGFSCSVPSGFSGTVTATTTTSGDFFDFVNTTAEEPYNLANAVSFSSSTGLISNVTAPVTTGTFWLFSSTAEVRGAITCSPADTCSEVNIIGNNGGSACIIEGNSIRCPVPLTGSSKTWSGTISMTNKTGYSNALQAVCGATGATTSTITVGPTDAPSQLNMCVTQTTIPASCTLDGVTVSSGESIVAFQSNTLVWPQTCSSISQTRICNSGTLTGDTSYNRSSCSQTQVAPELSWSSTNNSSVVWTAVNGATSYRLYTCTVANTNDLSSCSPNVNATSPSTTESTSTSLNPANKDTVCLRVRAVAANGQVSSASDETFCLHVKNTTYSYSPARP